MKLLTFLLFFVLLSLPAVAQVGGLLDSLERGLLSDKNIEPLVFEKKLRSYFKKNPEHGADICKKILSIGKQKKQFLVVYSTYKMLCRYYRDHSMLVDATIWLKDGIAYFSKHWKEGEGRMYLEGTFIHTNVLSEFDLGLNYAKKSEQIFKDIPNQIENYLMSLAMISVNYEGINKKDSSFFYRNKAYQISIVSNLSQKIKNEQIIYLADGYFRNNQYDQALTILDTLKNIESKEYPFPIANLTKAFCLMRKNRHIEAIPIFKHSYKMFEIQNSKNGIEDALSGLAVCYASLENYKEAYVYQAKTDSLRFLRLNTDVKAKILKQGYQFETERNQLKAQLEQERLEAENNNKVLKIENEKTAIQSKNALTELEKKALQSKNAEDSLKAKNEKDRLKAQNEQERQLAMYQQNQLRTTTYITLLIAFLVLSGLLYFLYTNRKINKQNAELEKQKIFIKHRLTNDFITVLGILDAKKRTADSVGKEAIASTVFPISALQDATLALLENSSLSIKAQMERMAKNLSEGLRKPDSISIESDELALVGSSALATLFIANELMYNSFKYNKEKPDLHIRIRMKKVNEQDFSFVFEDNGTGLGNQTFAELSKNRNKGMGLLKAYTQTLKATPQVESSENGLVFRFVGKIRNN